MRKAQHCQCLYEIENKLPRTKFCRVACLVQKLDKDKKEIKPLTRKS